MLNCILGMVDKTKRALAILQQRQQHQQHQQPQPKPFHHPHPATTSNSSSALPSTSSASTTTASSSNSFSLEYLEGLAALPPARRSAAFGEILAATIKSTEERVVEVRRRAEEAVQEVSNLSHVA